MTREEVIDHLKLIKRILVSYSKDENGNRVADAKMNEAIDTAIKALEQGACEDCISRQAAIKAIWDETNMDIYTSEVKEILENLPSVQPKERTGRWLHRNDDHNDWSECSECGYGDEGEVKFGEETPYCPYCGSRNEREDERCTKN